MTTFEIVHPDHNHKCGTGHWEVAIHYLRFTARHENSTKIRKQIFGKVEVGLLSLSQRNECQWKHCEARRDCVKELQTRCNNVSFEILTTSRQRLGSLSSIAYLSPLLFSVCLL